MASSLKSNENSTPFDFDDFLASVNRDVKALNLIEKNIFTSTAHSNSHRSPLKTSNAANVVVKGHDSFRSRAPKSVNAGSPNLKLPREVKDYGSQIVALASKVKEWIYCPLCPLRYRKESSLGMHVRSQHKQDLMALSTKSYNTFTYQNCPSCSSKFFKIGTLARHLTLYHSELVLDIWDAANHQSKTCYFCQQAFTEARTDAIINHVVSLHAEQFETLALIYLKKKTSESSVKTNEASQLLSPGATRSILRNSAAPNKTAKRALRFSVPEAVCHFYEKPSSGSSSSETNNDEAPIPSVLKFELADKEQTEETAEAFQLSVLNTPPSRLCGLVKPKSPRPKFTSTPVKRQRKNTNFQSRLHCLFHTALSPHSPSKLYRCASCHLRFKENEELLLHMRKHRSIHVKMRPLFSCGVCTAQFYKNEFLLKHCSDHHFRYVNTPPKCIKARDVLFNNVSNFSPLN